MIAGLWPTISSKSCVDFTSSRNDTFSSSRRSRSARISSRRTSSSASRRFRSKALARMSPTIRRRLTSRGVHSRGRSKSAVEIAHWIRPPTTNGTVRMARIPTRAEYSRSAPARGGKSPGRLPNTTSRPRWSCSKYQGKFCQTVCGGRGSTSGFSAQACVVSSVAWSGENSRNDARSVPNHSTGAVRVWSTSSSNRAGSMPTNLADRSPITFSNALGPEVMLIDSRSSTSKVTIFCDNHDILLATCSAGFRSMSTTSSETTAYRLFSGRHTRHDSCSPQASVPLMITVTKGPSETLVRVDGWLAGDAVAELERALDAAATPARLLVRDLRVLMTPDCPCSPAGRPGHASLDGLSPYIQLTCRYGELRVPRPSLSRPFGNTFQERRLMD